MKKSNSQYAKNFYDEDDEWSDAKARRKEKDKRYEKRMARALKKMNVYDIDEIMDDRY